MSELTAVAGPTGLARIEDPELQELLSYLPGLEASRLDSLKNPLRDMVAGQQMARFQRRVA